jgi:BirA family biotin operon repressor/biotin-[acetyl-CoA-carboxylase] ligase
MTVLKINNPFNAPVFLEDTGESTMILSRSLAQKGEPHGTVIAADYQEKGRGRQGRTWRTERGMSLLFTIMLRFSGTEEIPVALSLRVGLALCLAIEELFPSLKNRVMTKWPNDIIIDSKKIAGILCEADGGIVHTGIGVNIAQKKFSAPLEEKAGSISLAAGIDIEESVRFFLLEKILKSLYIELETSEEKNWKDRIEERLYKKGQNVIFIDGEADSGKEIKGSLYGIGESGELLIVPDGQTEVRPFVTGELVLCDGSSYKTFVSNQPIKPE